MLAWLRCSFSTAPRPPKVFQERAKSPRAQSGPLGFARRAEPITDSTSRATAIAASTAPASHSSLLPSRRAATANVAHSYTHNRAR